MLSCHSEYGSIKTVFLKRPANAFKAQKFIDEQWNELNYTSAPDMNRALEEYEAFEGLLKNENIEIKFMDHDDRVRMDSIYCRDASLATDHGMILCRMEKKQRMFEPNAAQITFEKSGIKILGKITAPGKLEGGDVAWLDTKTLAVGHGYRSNDEGFRQLKAILKPYDIQLIQVDLPHYRGANDVFHLMSILSPVDANLAVVYSPLMPVRFRNILLTRRYKFIEVPDKEFETMGCNVLAIAPGKCIMVKGNPVTKRALEETGCEVFEYEGNEISVKGGGGPTCLSRPLWRDLEKEGV